MFGRMKDPADGTATLVDYVETNTGNEFDTVVIAQVIVKAPGLEPTAVEWTVGVPHAELPMDPGRTWPVRVDRAKPSRLKLDDKRVEQEAEAARDAGRAQAEQIAESMREQGSTPTD
jgi:hypothetical protein